MWIAPALTEAYQRIRPNNAVYKHIVLLTDGISEEGDSMTLTREAQLNHVTISTVGLGQDVNRAFHAMNETYTGIFYVNASTIGAEVHLPFGGTKATGNGHREAGTQVLDIFSEWKSIYFDYSGKLQRAQIDNAKAAG